ncbi:uncharacterized protein LOC5510080 [Nematostella vectensis]|uniref:uncharacterized protein LOC5510080 n=1 Tax=Nematostella vectensis TaxID=45351 RepID=UPI0013903D4D|nr:uncharacterized protein LOC5510080 [Nematostella vectensis]
MMFVIHCRRHYDQATLAQLSDMLYHKHQMPALARVEGTILSALTEKKVETFHSLLRRNIEPWSNVAQIQNAARILNTNRLHNNFSDNFVNKYQKERASATTALFAEKWQNFWLICLLMYGTALIKW